jgi:transposase-like protein
MPLGRVKLLTHEDFLRELGVDLKRLKPEWKDEVTRTLYEHGMSYRQIASILGRSMRDISKAIKGGHGDA